MLNYIALAIPAFLLLIGVEVLIARFEKKDYYRFNDAINDMSCGIAQQVIGIFTRTAILATYVGVYQNFKVLEISSSSIVAWIALVFGVDFFYYWFHRVSHRMNAPWAAHIVHHQSEDFNLAVALRQSAFQSWFSWIFYLPLALIGFPPAMFLTVAAFDTLYQFWIHTQAIHKLGPLEWVMNTPSHHRVHHGRNPRYLDKNYAGIFIIWDRVFGTFVPETEPVVYGVTEPLNSWNPFWANFSYWIKLKNLAKQFPRFIDKVKLFFMPPEWRPAGVAPLPPHPEVSVETYVKFDMQNPRGLTAYVFVQFLPATFATFWILMKENTWPMAMLVALAAMILFTTLTLGGMLDRKGWAFWLEGARLVLAALLMLVIYRDQEWRIAVIILTAIAMLASVLWLSRFHSLFDTRAPQVVKV